MFVCVCFFSYENSFGAGVCFDGSGCDAVVYSGLALQQAPWHWDKDSGLMKTFCSIAEHYFIVYTECGIEYDMYHRRSDCIALVYNLYRAWSWIWWQWDKDFGLMIMFCSIGLFYSLHRAWNGIRCVSLTRDWIHCTRLADFDCKHLIGQVRT